MTINPKPGAQAPATYATEPSDKFDPLALELILNPPPGADFDLMACLVKWDELAKQAAFFKDWEMAFRKRAFEVAFPQPKDGVNNFALANGYVLKGTPKVNVKVDKEMFPSIRARLAAQNISLDSFLKVAYSLDAANYKAAKSEADADENSAVRQWLPILNEMITTTPGSPTLEVVLPAKNKKG